MTTTTLGAITPEKQALLDALANTQKSLDVEVRRQEARPLNFSFHDILFPLFASPLNPEQ